MRKPELRLGSRRLLLRWAGLPSVSLVRIYSNFDETTPNPVRKQLEESAMLAMQRCDGEQRFGAE